MIIATRMGIAAYVTLRRARLSFGLTQKQVAERIGITASQFNRVENGHDTVNSDQLMLWAAAVGCTLTVTRNDVVR